MNTPKRYNPFLVTLHWLTVIVMLGAGFLSEDEGGSSPITIHMKLGAILLILMIARLIVRFTTQRPGWADAGNSFFNKVGELTHLGLYGIAFFILGLGGLIAFKRNLIGYALDATAQVSRAGSISIIHHLGWLLAMLLIALHVGAALYHQIILKDNLLARMWYGK